MNLKIVLLVTLIICSLTAGAQSITGKWRTFDDSTGDAKSIVEISERGGKIYGKVIQVLNPAMKDVKCKNCSDADKDKPVLGLEILKGLSKDGEKYSGGKILDPSNGKTYKCVVSLGSDGKLNVRGYVGFSAFGRTQTWSREK